MLDLTVIFLVAGFLLGKFLFETSQDEQERSIPPGDQENMNRENRGLGDSLAVSSLAVPSLAAKSEQSRVQPTVRLQWILGWIVVFLGVIYAIAFVATNPFYDRFSFSTFQLMLIKLLPSMALGFLAGAIVRIGLRLMKPLFLVMGAVFFVLPFLLLNGPGMIEKLKKFKVGPWFEAEINSTETKQPVQLQLQSLIDPTESPGLSSLDTDILNSTVNKYKISKEMCDYIQCNEINSGYSLIETQAAESLSTMQPGMNGVEFYGTYIEPFVNEIAKVEREGEDGSLSKERALREAVDPVARAGARLLQEANRGQTENDWSTAWCGFLTKLRKAEANLGQIVSIGETNLRPFDGEASECADTPIPKSQFTSMALPYMLVARLYRRAGFDARALRVLQEATGLEEAGRNLSRNEHIPPSKASEWAELFIERGNLRHSLGDPQWGNDWRNAITLREQVITKLWDAHGAKLSDSRIENACPPNTTPDPDPLQLTVARLEIDTAQLRNRYVFSLIDNNQQRRTITLNGDRLEDVVATARQNYLNIERLALLSRCLPDTNYAACIQVIYPDTYALALMAAAQRQDPADRLNTSVRIEGLLEQSLESVLGPENKRCRQWSDFKKIIQKHRKLARSLAL